MPTLYVIAGPNGAGKSTLSGGVLPEGISSFDGDKQLQELKNKFPDTNDAQLSSHVNDVLFPQAKEKAIKEGRDFAYETNFATEEVMKTVGEFKDKGYETELIYIGLPSVDQAMGRVKMRVDQAATQSAGKISGVITKKDWRIQRSILKNLIVPLSLIMRLRPKPTCPAHWRSIKKERSFSRQRTCRSGQRRSRSGGEAGW